MKLEGGEGSASRPGRSLPPGKTPYPLYRRLGGLQGRSGQVQKISPPPGFDPRTVQPVASRYTRYGTRPTWFTNNICKKMLLGCPRICNTNVIMYYNILGIVALLSWQLKNSNCIFNFKVVFLVGRSWGSFGAKLQARHLPTMEFWKK